MNFLQATTIEPQTLIMLVKNLTIGNEIEQATDKSTSTEAFMNDSTDEEHPEAITGSTGGQKIENFESDTEFEASTKQLQRLWIQPKRKGSFLAIRKAIRHIRRPNLQKYKVLKTEAGVAFEHAIVPKKKTSSFSRLNKCN